MAFVVVAAAAAATCVAVGLCVCGLCGECAWLLLLLLHAQEVLHVVGVAVGRGGRYHGRHGEADWLTVMWIPNSDCSGQSKDGGGFSVSKQSMEGSGALAAAGRGKPIERGQRVGLSLSWRSPRIVTQQHDSALLVLTRTSE